MKAEKRKFKCGYSDVLYEFWIDNESPENKYVFINENGIEEGLSDKLFLGRFGNWDKDQIIEEVDLQEVNIKEKRSRNYEDLTIKYDQLKIEKEILETNLEGLRNTLKLVKKMENENFETVYEDAKYFEKELKKANIQNQHWKSIIKKMAAMI